MNNNLIAVSIIVGFGMVAGALFVSGSDTGNVKSQGDNNQAQQVVPDDSPRRADSNNAYVYGSPDAEITIVEFSDYECPFCSRLHPTLGQIVDESDGRINWEFRHLPLPSHRNAEVAAYIGECVGRNQGNEAFWEYTDIVFKNQRSVNETFLEQTAQNLGVSSETIKSCLSDDSIKSQVATDLATVRAFGGNGTPFSVVVFPDGTTQGISGALPYESWAPLLNI